MDIIEKDIIIIGGGLAGICASIAAARENKSVALIQNRGILGGNSSSEIRVWVCGATKHGVHRYARETGIMGELFLENQFRNPQGNVYHWDTLLLDKVNSENNIDLYLNTEVITVQMGEGESSIKSVSAHTQGNERDYIFFGKIFIDCTGDGVVGFKAGAEYAYGRESKDIYNESLAPAFPDKDILGSTLLFYTKQKNEKIKFIPPNNAKRLEDTAILKNRIIKSDDSGCSYWWIEWGGELDTIKDNEVIRDELLSIIYGIWDHIKNSGEYNSDYLDLEWVGTLPGKRESRRFIGDYTLTQRDIESQKTFKDKVAFGGWSIDLHPSTGVYTETAGAKHLVSDGIYDIPYRVLYSNNIDNLYFAGRNISVSHVAFGSTRVMGTCAILGEAAGTAAAISVEIGCTPRDIYNIHFQRYQQKLLKNDASIIGVTNLDNKDIAKLANIKATSYLKELDTSSSDMVRNKFLEDIGIQIPIELSNNHRLDLLLDIMEKTTLYIEIYTSGKKNNYIPRNKISSFHVELDKSLKKWVSVKLPNFDTSQNIFIVLKANSHILYYTSNVVIPGVLTFLNQPIKELNDPKLHDYSYKSPILYWTNHGMYRKNLVFKSKTIKYKPETIINGYVRPYGDPNLWVSDLKLDKDNSITLSWDSKQIISEIQIIFNDDVNEDIINLHHHKTEFPVIPELIKDYEIWGWLQGEKKLLKQVFNNRCRKNNIKLDYKEPIDELEIKLINTNGSNFKSLFEVRVY